MNDATPADLLGTVHEVQLQLQEYYMATEAQINTDGEDSATVRLQFDGFSDLDAAFEKITDIALEIEDHDGADVDAGVSSNGYGREEDDTRPSGWITATFDADANLAECTCGPNEACGFCGGQ